jgi:hypothetical protein
MSQRTSIGLLALLLFVVALVNAWTPLQRSHWDAPIYLYNAKRFADTPWVASYIEHSESIASQVTSGQLPIGEGYSESYWRFTRLGHISLLGSLITVFGNDEAGIQAAVLIYALFFAAGILAAMLASRACAKLYLPVGEERQRLGQYILFAAFAYGLSGSYSYMAANLIAEIPALLCVALGFWSIIHAIQRYNRPWAAVSGLLAYISFAIMLESVWFFLALYLALWLAPPTEQSRRRIAILLFWAGGTAIAGFGLHSWLFGTLVSPSTVLAFLMRVNTVLPSSEAGRLTPLIATGLLWLAIPLALRSGWHTPLSRFAWLWFLLCLIPLIMKYTGGEIQTRMFALIVVPLILLGAIGFSSISKTLLNRPSHAYLTPIMVVVVLATFSIAHPLTYTYLRELPGLHRLQYVRAFLWPPAYEVKSYPLAELNLMANRLYSAQSPICLVIGPGVKQENLNLIRFFGPAYPRSASLAKESDPTNILPCGVLVQPLPHESVIFRRGKITDCCLRCDAAKVLKLTIDNPAKPDVFRGLNDTARFSISEACRGNNDD